MQNVLRLDRIDIDRWFLRPVLPFSSWILEQLFAQKDYLFLWVPVFFAFGIAFYFSLPFEPPLILSFILWAFWLSVHFFVNGYRLRMTSFALFLVISGFFAACVHTAVIHTPVLDKRLGTVDVEGIVHSVEPLEEGGGSRIIMRELSIERLSSEETPRLIRLRLRKDDNVVVGQRISVLASLNPPSSPVVPGGFDFRRYMYFQGIGAVGFIFNAPVILDDAPRSFFNIERMRQSIAKRIKAALHPEHAGVAMALITGQKNALTDEDRQALRDAGLAHMLAISGLHVGLVSGALFFFLRLVMASFSSFALRYPVKKVAAVCALLGAIFYMVLAGATVPTQRAVLMSAIVFLAVILDRSPISLRLVAFSALIVLIVSPNSLLSASFHMSFAAVTCLIYFYELSRTFWRESYQKTGFVRKVMLYFIAVCMTTVIASLATAPFALYHFGQVSFIGSLANLVAVPLLAFVIMPFALVSMIFLPLGLEYWPLQIVGFGVEGILQIAHWAAALPHAIIRTPAWSFSGFVMMVLSILWIILWKGWGKALSLPFLMVSFALLHAQTQPNILVASSHKLFLFKFGDHIFASSRRSDRFVLENWEEFYGLAEGSAKLLPYKGGVRDVSPLYTCGAEGCRFVMRGQKISFVRDAYYIGSECAWADVVLSEEPVNKRQCGAQVVIDKFDTWRSGAHALTIVEDGAVHVQNVAQSISGRAWSESTKTRH